MSRFQVFLITSLVYVACAIAVQRFSLGKNFMRPSMSYDVKSVGSVHSISFEVAGKKMNFETGKMGRQAGGSVVAKTGDTMVYSTVCSERDATPVDFTPLRVDYFARYSAVGQTVGAFHRRDSRGDDSEILVARLIDRPIRPMIAEGWQHETQILTWVLSYDKTHPPEALSICCASAAMCISDVPMMKPVAGVEVGLVDGVLTVNPTKQEMAKSSLQLTLAGTKEGILMIEGASDFLSEEIMVDALRLGHKAIGEICDGLKKFQEIAGVPKKLDTLRKSPADLLDKMDKQFGEDVTVALSIGDKHKRGAAVAGVESKITTAFAIESPSVVSLVESLTEKIDADTPHVTSIADDDMSDLSSPPTLTEVLEEDEASELPTIAISKTSGGNIETEGGVDLLGKVSGSNNNINKNRKVVDKVKPYDPIDIKIAMKKLLVRKLRQMIQIKGVRSDGRSVTEVRPLAIETSLLPCAHGSCLFTRGETQSLATATLGSKSMEAKFETLDENSAKRFYLQYRFPPSSVGEVGRTGMVNRREVGHGNLAERALMRALPPPGVFPYSIRAESFITESCGSSSMATVCSCSLAMLDAGVPLLSPVAGVAMGLILGEKELDEAVILTDILGLEDALGTMDFKVAGNASGITTFQLDIKSEGLTLGILEKALLQAKNGRLHILEEMNKILSIPKPIKDTVPKILEFKIPPDCLGKVIGPKGKTVQTAKETYEVTSINLEDDGSVQVESFSHEKNQAVKEFIMKIVEEASNKDSSRRRGGDRSGGSEDTAGGGEGEKKVVEIGPPPEIGMIYRGCKIISAHNFGVFVEVSAGHEGLVHVSELDSKRVNEPEKAGFVTGALIDVKYIGNNEKGQMRLSRRAVLLRDSPSNATGGPLNTTTNPDGSPMVSTTGTGVKIKSALSSASAEAAFNDVSSPNTASSSK